MVMQEESHRGMTGPRETLSAVGFHASLDRPNKAAFPRGSKLNLSRIPIILPLGAVVHPLQPCGTYIRTLLQASGN